MYSSIICTKDNKTKILEKAKAAGLDFRLACPDGLISMEKGISVSWYGIMNHEEHGEISQFRLSLKNIDILSMPDDTPIVQFLISLNEAWPASPANDKYNSVNLKLVEKGVFTAIFNA